MGNLSLADARAELASRLYEVKGKPGPEVEAPDRWFYNQRVTTLLPAGQYQCAGELRKVQAELLKDPQTWK